MGIHSMLAYGPELYELQPWGGTGDSRFNLDNDTQAVNLLTNEEWPISPDSQLSDLFPPNWLKMT